MRCRGIGVLLSLWALATWAQTSQPQTPPPFISSPSMEDRNLYDAFFVAQQAVFAANQAAKTKNPAAAAQIDQQAAATLHITVAELPIVVDLLQQANQSYAQIPALRQAYVASGSSLKLTPAQLDGIDDFRKLDITARTFFLLYVRLSPASFAGLRHYINTEFKNSQAQPKP